MSGYLFLVLKFTIFYLIICLTGRAFLIFLLENTKHKLIDEDKFIGLPIYFLYPIFGLIFIGNYLFIVNFFVPLTSYWSSMFLLINIYNLKEKIHLSIIKNSFYYFFPFLILLVSSYSISFHYDSGLYHMNNQLWINESNIVFGFANIYGPFGVSSIYEYISAYLWIDGSYILLHFLNLIFIGFFYQILIYLIFFIKDYQLKNVGIVLMIFALLDNLGYSGGRNGFIYIQGIGKQDTALAVLFLFVSIFTIYAINKNIYNKKNLILLSWLSFFIFQLKISGFPVFLIYCFYLYRFIKHNKINNIFELKNLTPLILIASMWVMKTVIQTGCLIFPLTSSCFKNLTWVDINYIKTIEEISVQYSISYSLNSSFFQWLNDYLSNPINKSIIFNFIFSFLIILLFINRKIKFFKTNRLQIITFIILSTLYYLFFGPDPRYIMGLQLLIISLAGLYTKKVLVNNKYLLSMMLIFSLLLLPRLNDYRSFNGSLMPSLNLPNVELINFENRFIPADGDQCWANLECSSGFHKYEIETKGNYKTVYLKK